MRQYADDTQLYLSFYLNELDSAVKKINTDLQFISDISKAHNLVLNETKTEMLIFGSNRMAIIENIDFKIVINNQTLTASTCSKNLGLQIYELYLKTLPRYLKITDK